MYISFIHGNVLPSDGHHLAAFPEGDLRRGDGLLPPAACRRGDAVDRSHGGSGSQSHAVPVHRGGRARGSRSLRERAAGQSHRGPGSGPGSGPRMRSRSRIRSQDQVQDQVQDRIQDRVQDQVQDLFFSLQIILMTLESNKATVMLSALDFNPDEGQKTLIVANSAEEVEDVFKVMTFSLHAPFTRCREPVLLTMDPLPVSSDLQVVSNKSAFCLKTHEGLTHQFDIVMQQWRKDIGPGTHVILGKPTCVCVCACAPVCVCACWTNQ